MVIRMALLGRARPEDMEQVYKQSKLKDQQVLYQQRFVYRDFLVIYVEWEGESEERAHRNVLDSLGDNSLLRPIGLDGRRFAVMELLFSYNRPQNAAHWRRKVPGVACGALARIRPGRLGSYAYYHHILQETTVCKRDKYGAIFVFGDVLFYYREQPGEQEIPWYQGEVHGTVPEEWNALMRTHFAVWVDGKSGWNEMKGGEQICVTG